MISPLFKILWETVESDPHLQWCGDYTMVIKKTKKNNQTNSAKKVIITTQIKEINWSGNKQVMDGSVISALWFGLKRFLEMKLWKVYRDTSVHPPVRRWIL